MYESVVHFEQSWKLRFELYAFSYYSWKDVDFLNKLRIYRTILFK